MVGCRPACSEMAVGAFRVSWIGGCRLHMHTDSLFVSDPVRLSEFERHHAQARKVQLCAPGIYELAMTLAVTIFMAPFSFVIALVIPKMGLITVALSFSLTACYLISRRSLLVAFTVLGGTLLFWGVFFETIQAIKNNLEVPLFVLTATGIPVSVMYCMFIGTKIWTIRGGVD